MSTWFHGFLTGPPLFRPEDWTNAHRGQLQLIIVGTFTMNRKGLLWNGQEVYIKSRLRVNTSAWIVANFQWQLEVLTCGKWCGGYNVICCGRCKTIYLPNSNISLHTLSKKNKGIKMWCQTFHIRIYLFIPKAIISMRSLEIKYFIRLFGYEHIITIPIFFSHIWLQNSIYSIRPLSCKHFTTLLINDFLLNFLYTALAPWRYCGVGAKLCFATETK